MHSLTHPRLAIKYNELLPFVTRMYLKGIMQSEQAMVRKINTIRFNLYLEYFIKKEMDKHNKTETESELQRTKRLLPERMLERRLEK